MITDFYGWKCKYVRRPWISNCYYDLALKSLNHMFGGVLNNSAWSFNSSRFFSFPQDASVTYLDKLGYAYVPEHCEKKQCAVHMVFHGCQQGVEFINTTYVEFTGYNHVAETNDIIILYPQMKSSENNTFGCWDFWGFSSSGRTLDYATKNGIIMKSMYKIFEDLTAGTLPLKVANISGPVQIDTLDECIKCYNGDNTWVCSVDGIAFCCELGDHH